MTRRERRERDSERKLSANGREKREHWQPRRGCKLSLGKQVGLTIHIPISMMVSFRTGPSTPSQVDEITDDESDGEEETDKDRRRTMLDTMSQSDLDTLKTSRNAFIDDFFFPSSQHEPGPSRPRSSNGPLDDTGETGCDIHVLPKPGATAASSSGKGKRSLHQSTLDSVIDVDELEDAESTSRPKKKTKVSYGSIVADEVKFRKRETLGLTGEGRQLGRRQEREADADDLGRNFNHGGTSVRNADGHARKHEPEILDLTEDEASNENGKMWACGVCTL